MQTEILKIVGLNDGCADRVSDILIMVDGVTTVSLGVQSATVQFDEKLTSVQKLQAILENVDFSVESVKQADKKAGGCCGGCGGGGGGCHG